jgi:cbb3-type cytochrome c oxidase subunit III
VSDDFLRRTIAFGKQGTEMQGFMKRPRSPLGADDVDHLVAYLRRLQKNPPPQPLNRKYSWASAKDGLKAFEGKGGCVKCHGVGGVGASGPALGNPAFLKSATNGFLTGTIILGRENTPMHSYYDGEGTHLEEDDIENVVAYLRGLQDATFIPSRRVATSPEAVAAGRGLFRLNCARCHGDSGEGRRVAASSPAAPSLNNPEFLKAAGDEFLLATIALGRPGTPMPAFGDGMAGKAGLTADQIRQIIAFMRSWEKHR